MRSKQQKSRKSLKEKLQLLKCFSSTKHKCRYLCTTNDENIEALGDLLQDYLGERLKIPNLKRITKVLHPIRHMIRVLADKKVKTQDKRKILLEFGVKLLLYPILQKNLIPCFGRLIENK